MGGMITLRYVVTPISYRQYVNLWAQIAVEFAIASVLCIVIFMIASLLVHGLFHEQPNHKSIMRPLVAQL